MIKTAILGATGMVGRKFAKLLIGHPMFEAVAYTGVTTVDRPYRKVWEDTEKGLHDAYGDVWAIEEFPSALENIVIEKTDLEAIAQKANIVFSALKNNKETEELEKNLAARGVKVFSNAGCMRMNHEIPLVVAEVNPSDLGLVESQPWYSSGGFIVKNANCTTIGLVLALKPIYDLYGLKEVVVATQQALSGKGDDSYAKGVMFGNVYPFISGEEKKVIDETRKMLHLENLKISPICTRVNVRDGHMESVWVRTERKPNIPELEEYIDSFNPLKDYNLPSSPERPIILTREEDRPQPKLDVNNGRGMSVTIGRLSYDTLFDLKFICLSHNTIRGAAGASIQNAELYFKMFENI